MYVPDAIGRAFKQESVPHETGVLAAIESVKPLTGVNDHWISVAVEAMGEDRRSGGSVSRGEWEDLGLKSGLLATVEPEWLKKVQICSLNDVDFRPLLKLGMNECKMLSVSERISLKQ